MLPPHYRFSVDLPTTVFTCHRVIRTVLAASCGGCVHTCEGCRKPATFCRPPHSSPPLAVVTFFSLWVASCYRLRLQGYTLMTLYLQRKSGVQEMRWGVGTSTTVAVVLHQCELVSTILSSCILGLLEPRATHWWSAAKVGWPGAPTQVLFTRPSGLAGQWDRRVGTK